MTRQAVIEKLFDQFSLRFQYERVHLASCAEKSTEDEGRDGPKDPERPRGVQKLLLQPS